MIFFVVNKYTRQFPSNQIVIEDNDTHRIILGDVFVYPLRKKDCLFGGIVAIMYLCHICFIMV